MHEEVFPRLVETYYAALYRFALSLTRSPADAGDLTQQTFFIWATKGESLREFAKVKSWLFTTLYREFLRSRRRDTRAAPIEELPSDQETPHVPHEVIDKMDAELVMQALQEIDPVFREPLSLFYLQELTYTEIAELLGVPIGTVMSRLSRGKAHLRARLAEKAKGGRLITFPHPGIRL